MAIIAIEGIKMRAFHGVYAEERVEGNNFCVDVYMDIDTSRAAKSDDLADTLDYSVIHHEIVEIMRQPQNLLERLNMSIGEAILRQSPDIQSVRVKVSKYRPMYMESCEKVFHEDVYVKK